jgi:hypothetical protein
MQEYFSSTDSNFNTTKRRNVIIADLIAQALANAGPELGKPAMTVTSNLVPDALANAAPELGAPSIVAEEVEEVNAPLQPIPSTSATTSMLCSRRAMPTSFPPR